MKPTDFLRAAILSFSICACSWNAVSQVTLRIVSSTNIATGYFQVSGHYLYFANGSSGLSICDISDPSHPVITGQAASSPYTAYGVAVSGQYAYLLTSGGLNIYDVSSPTNPFIVGSTNFAVSFGSIIVSNDIAYVSGSGLSVFDVSDPANPRKIGQTSSGVRARSLSDLGNVIFFRRIEQRCGVRV